MGKARVIGTTIDAIRAAETELGRTLPKSFSDWLLDNNGKALGALVVFPVFDARDPRKTWESIVRHFKEDWQEWQENFSGNPIDFSNLLPFAEFGTGDYYCFDYGMLCGAGEPVVVLWSHETGRTST
ncbi:SMI1/KNR4 family protein, partial [Burkholderia sp. Ac-20384]|uniref:SMI1/KNR4 family protein n=1 Tax=Burkholderia sp. Ac-20384 TaxID=2703902 RepID=UPI00197EFDEA